MEFIIRDGMSLTPGEKVKVYFNIRKNGFSIVSLDKNNPNKGKVVAYASNVIIKDAIFHLNLNTLAGILEKQCKAVYATVKGVFVAAAEMDNSSHRKGYCNPYKTGKFIDWESGDELKEAEEVYFYDKYFSYR
ncbi:hypothetical protein [Metabacillus fastidiosus]|uniref:Uncharacterized protein n=1 Tax=Metabacillus fastidiosus TaxID=1458 RepID=A0ABU6NSZ8_9BACI|nr:hypothetical protein [Metabacillus fastidiosus]MED4400272.1 hypothetical protein [Metabacillus fastidiosus]